MTEKGRPNVKPSEWDAVVIGSGMGGLAAAAYLATNGLRTLVLEQHYVAGGNSHVFRRKARHGRLPFEFDVGVHYIGDCGPGGTIPTILKGVGLEGKIEFLEMDPDGFSTLVFPGLTFRVPKGWDRYRERLVAALPDDETGIHRCLDVLEGVSQEFRNLSLPVRPEDMPRVAKEAPNFMAWGMRTLAQLFDECGLGQKARAVLTGESGDYALPPSKTPVLLHAILTDHYMRGAYYPRGGGQVLAARLVQVIRAHGGEVRTGVRVLRILVQDGAACGVLLAHGEEVRAPLVVSNADIKRTLLEMVGEEHLSPATVARAKQWRMALPIFCVYLGLDIDLKERIPNTNYFLFTSFDVEGMYRDCEEGRMPRDLWVYLTAASVKDPYTRALAPEGHSALEIMTLVPADYRLWGVETGPTRGENYHRNPRYRSFKAELTEAMIDAAARVIPDIREHIVWKEAATPVTQERYTLSTGGTSYGIAMTPDQFGPGRPGPATEIRGLYLAGASTVYGHGIAGAMAGGMGAASAALGRDLMAEVKAGRVFGDPSRLPPDPPDWDPWRASR